MATLSTPSKNGTTFSFDINSDGNIIITSQNGMKFDYHIDAIKDLYLWLKYNKNGEWVFLGSKNEDETPNQGTVEEWARSSTNSIGGFYGLKDKFKGRFASFVPPILEKMQLVEIEHNAKSNRMRAL